VSEVLSENSKTLKMKSLQRFLFIGYAGFRIVRLRSLNKIKNRKVGPVVLMLKGVRQILLLRTARRLFLRLHLVILFLL
jgi:hypothetical protein